jgi:GDP-mannose 6-dehydrogenase
VRPCRAAPVALCPDGLEVENMDISVFGLGYVGTVSAVGLARLGHRVIGVDIDQHKVDQIGRGISPVVEPGIAELLHAALAADRLSATTDSKAAVHGSDLSLVCVGTPSGRNGSASIEQVMRVVREIGEAMRSKPTWHGVVIRSTSPPGTTHLATDVIAQASGKAAGVGFGVAMNPEFMREGTSIDDFEHPPYTVVGTSDARLAEMLAEMYTGVGGPFYQVGTREAELMKYACNAFHAVKVTFANEIGAIGKRLGIDSHKVMDLLVADTKLNLSPAYLKPGFAFGGSCLPKDLRAILYEARRLDLSVPMLSAVATSNSQQIERVIAWVLAEKRRKVGVLGLSFKSGTDDLRESPIVHVVETLLGKGCDLAVYDSNVNLARLIGANKSYIEREIPHVSLLMRSSIQEVIDHADVLLVANKGPDFRAALEGLRPDQKVYDLVRIMDEPGSSDASYQGICW